jgi:hypothetical protein
MMAQLRIQKSLKIRSNASKAWEIIGPNFLTISEWGSGIRRSWNNPDLAPKFENAPAGGRFCELTDLGTFDERILHFDQDKYEITWSAEGEKLPKFIFNLKNEISIRKLDEEHCVLHSTLSANLRGIKGLLLESMLKKTFSKQIDVFLMDWQNYAETGEISPGKKREKSKELSKSTK